MTKEEYLSAKAKLNKEFEERLKDLDKEFALSNNDVEVGDIVSDRSHTIRVERILIDTPWRGSMPRAYFEGTKLTKKLEPFKSGEKVCVFNVEKHIRKED